MRVSAQIDRSAHGRITEAGEIVGRFTLEGTLGLVIFSGIFTGIFVAFLWTLVSGFLPAGRARRRLAAGIVAVALGARVGIDGRNIDFRILDPGWLQALLFVVLAGATGIVVVAIEDRLADRSERSPRTPGLGSWLFLGAGVLMGVPLLASSYFSQGACFCVSVPWVVGVFLVALAAVWMVRFVTEVRDIEEPGWVGSIGGILVAAVTVAGLWHLGGEIAHFV
jgi:drug/metabolite transporter (DMT)-like permease